MIKLNGKFCKRKKSMMMITTAKKNIRALPKQTEKHGVVGQG
jgi:hypothetical protein